MIGGNMLSRKTFVSAIENIKKHEELMAQIHKPLNELGDFPLDLDLSKLHRDALLSVLKESMHDTCDYISWWLYEDVEHIIYWMEDDKEISRDLTDVNALYDYLLEGSKTIPFEKLPIFELDAKKDATGKPRKAIEKEDFLTYFDRVLKYIEIEKIVLVICENGEPDCVLMSVENYEQMSDRNASV